MIQYAAQTHSTGTPSPDVKTFSVQCAAEKKATAGGFKWLGTPPIPTDYQFVDEYPDDRLARPGDALAARPGAGGSRGDHRDH